MLVSQYFSTSLLGNYYYYCLHCPALNIRKPGLKCIRNFDTHGHSIIGLLLYSYTQNLLWSLIIISYYIIILTV